MMHHLLSLALFTLPIVYAAPQGIGAVICDQTAVTPWQYKDSQPPEDVTNNYGDQGWENYDADVCTSNQQSCSRVAGTSVTRTIGIQFTLGGETNLEKAIEGGLDFGVSVSWSSTTSQSTVEQCPASKDDTKNCACGLQSRAVRQRAVGTKTATNECGHTITAQYDITAPVVKGDQGKPYVIWRACRSSQSTCSDIVNMPACADGV